MENAMYAGIILDQSINQILDYSIPDHLKDKIAIGSRVLIPVNRSLRKGVVWHVKETTTAPYTKEVQEILSDFSVLTPDLIHLANWMSQYYATPLFKILQMILPKHIRDDEDQQLELVVNPVRSLEELRDYIRENRQKKRAQCAALEFLVQRGNQIRLADLLKESKVCSSSIKSLVQSNLISVTRQPKVSTELWDVQYFLSAAKKLSEEQQNAFSKIEQSLLSRTFAAHLLYGVTGSGKTEIYLQLIEKALSMDLGVIFLVPEIALASQTIERLKSRFEEKIAVLHHRLSAGEKKESWHQIREKKARIVVGARSAIFSPMPNLGLIFVDEEQENSYKHVGDMPCYNARDVAVMRAKFAGAAVVLGSATPSLESYQNALTGKYCLSMLTKRPENVTMPKVRIIDMSLECVKQKKKAIFSDALLTAIRSRLAVGEQSLLLLNRRGYHTSQVCLQCSFTAKCPHCDSLLTFHLKDNMLACHLCNYEIPPHTNCPKCHSGSPMKFRGIGTELVEKALYAIFPDVRVLRMDADTTKKKESHEAIFRKFRSGKADILVGTQMIAKGLHFPLVTLVGVLDADLSLNVPDFRASEVLFQLITQVAGRAGRSDLPGEVLIQTLLPSQPTLLHAAKQDYQAFFEEEAQVRKLFEYPPFTRIIKAVFFGSQEQSTREKAEEVRDYLLKNLPSSVSLLPISACGHPKIADEYRFQFLIKTRQIQPVTNLFMRLQRSAKIRMVIDVDPITTFF